MNRGKLIFAIVSLGIAACARDLKPKDDGPDTSMMSLGHIETHELGRGLFHAQADAESETEWRYYDLETKSEVSPANPDDSDEWDLAFQRFRIKTNGGISGTGHVEVGFALDTDLAATTRAPSGLYVSDHADGEDMDNLPDYAFNTPHSASETGWYVYNPLDHTLSPASVVYVIHTVEDAYVKIRMTGYYSDSGSPGFPAFDFGTIDPPESVDDGTIHVQVGGSSFVHISLSQHAVVQVGDPSTSLDWDLGVREAAWQTNSGGGRPGNGGARLAPAGATYDSISTSTTTDFVADAMIPFPGAPGSGMFLGNAVLSDWYNYDFDTHTASPRGLVHLVRTARGDYGKLTIVEFDNAGHSYKIRFDPIEHVE